MRRDSLVTTLKLLAACLVVGLVMAFFEIKPFGMFNFLWDIAQTLAEWIGRSIAWAGPYVILGAGIVLPVWLVMVLWRRLRGR